MKYQYEVNSIDPNTVHGKILKQIKKGSCVLECGCASGYITKFLKEKLDCKVYIIEYDQQGYNTAAEFAEGGVCGDLNKDTWVDTFKNMQFDYILFMDVLEHLINPKRVLQQAAHLLKEDGTVHISLPNIAHNDILINLYQNDFSYTHVGLLDDTHIKFFGKKNLKGLIADTGLEIVELDQTYIPTGTSEQFWHRPCHIPEELFFALAKREEGDVYQYIISAKKSSYINSHNQSVLDIEDSKYEGNLHLYRQYAQNLIPLRNGEYGNSLTHVIEKYELAVEEKNELSRRNESLIEQCRTLEDSLHAMEVLAKRATEKYELAVEEKNELSARNESLTEQCRTLEDSLHAMEVLAKKANENYQTLEQQYLHIVSSRGYRLLTKYYKLRDLILPKGSRRRRIVKSIVKRLLSPFRKNKSEELPQEVVTVDGFNLISHCKKIDIVTVPHTAYFAKAIQNAIKSAGLDCNIHWSEPVKYEDIPYIMICPQNFKRFPPVYIAFQMEQTVNSRWLTDEYMEILYNAYAIFDYSLENIQFFNADPRIASKLYYLPVDFCDGMRNGKDESDEKEYDILFYGDIYNERRQKYLKAMGEKYNLHIISNLFGEELYKEMNKAKIIVNIHYYENALLETARLYEALSVSDCIIVSEYSGDPREEKRLEGLVDFVDVGDIDAMMERVDYWLSNEDVRKAETNRRRNEMVRRESALKFYLYRFLLANDRITFDDFYKDVGDYVHFDTDRICLSIPESTERRASFDKDNQYGFDFFPALKHRIGWIGCGMSYKFMLRKAMEQNMDQILICEDDVYFPPDFQERFDHVLAFIQDHNDWSVFSGIMADIGRVKILECADSNEEEFVYLNKMISMVFNIYDKSIFEAISSWDNTNRDVEHNTIDRYLENRELRILTTCPFLVGHKEDLSSTIWGAQNTIYTDLVANSSIKLRELVDKFKDLHVAD